MKSDKETRFETIKNCITVPRSMDGYNIEEKIAKEIRRKERHAVLAQAYGKGDMRSIIIANRGRKSCERIKTDECDDGES